MHFLQPFPILMGMKYHLMNNINIQREENAFPSLKQIHFPKVSNHSIIAAKWSKTLRACLFLPGMKRSRPRLGDQASPHPAMLRSTVITDSACEGWRWRWRWGGGERGRRWAEWGRVVWVVREAGWAAGFFWKTFFLSSHVWREPVPCPPIMHHSTFTLARGAQEIILLEMIRGGEEECDGILQLFLVFWGGFQWFLCELQGDIDWLGWCRGWGWDPKVQVAALTPEQLGWTRWNLWGWEALTVTEVEIPCALPESSRQLLNLQEVSRDLPGGSFEYFIISEPFHLFLNY